MALKRQIAYLAQITLFLFNKIIHAKLQNVTQDIIKIPKQTNVRNVTSLAKNVRDHNLTNVFNVKKIFVFQIIKRVKKNVLSNQFVKVMINYVHLNVILDILINEVFVKKNVIFQSKKKYY